MLEKAIVVYKPINKCFEKARAISSLLSSHGVRAHIITVDDLSHAEKADLKEEAPGLDLLVSVGGDGTFLRSARAFTSPHSNPLILPYPCGRRNAYYEHLSFNVEEIVNSVMSGKFFVELLPRSRVCYASKCTYFLNEAVVVSTDLGKVSTYRVEVTSPSAKSRYSFEGDGVIVSTSPGSSGYNLSAKGPLMAPLTEAVLITPLNPLQLGVPTAVFPSLASVRVTAKNESYLYVDGDLFAVLKRNSSIDVTSGFNYAKVIRVLPFRDIMRVAVEYRQQVLQ
ncbi:MAG: diacylglycerol kinase family protein [Desulfurococcaceae archaeon]